MELIEWILQDENINKAIKAVKKNKGAYGIDKMSVEELDGFLRFLRETAKILNTVVVNRFRAGYNAIEDFCGKPQKSSIGGAIHGN